MKNETRHTAAQHERAPRAPIYKQKKKDIYAASSLRETIAQDPRIEDSTNVGLEYERLGFLKGRKLHIIGKVQTELDKNTVEEIVREYTPKKDEISNELKVQE